ncbi:MAG: hypothetical protein M3Y06_03565, partial [Actinomycetota bacterium]|nr:hypothetical protein [Actinomycetota bacterium]
MRHNRDDGYRWTHPEEVPLVAGLNLHSRRTLLTVAAAVAVGATAFASVPALASTSRGRGPEPVRSGSSYLALGDSVSFGYREPANLPTPNYTKASNFVGFPEDVARALGLRVANASCPGETSGSL